MIVGDCAILGGGSDAFVLAETGSGSDEGTDLVANLHHIRISNLSSRETERCVLWQLMRRLDWARSM